MQFRFIQNQLSNLLICFTTILEVHFVSDTDFFFLMTPVKFVSCLMNVRFKFSILNYYYFGCGYAFSDNRL